MLNYFFSSSHSNNNSNNNSNNKLSEWEEASQFSKWTFSVVNKVIKLGMKRQLNLEDLLQLPSKDSSNNTINKLEYYYLRSKSIFGIPRLLISLWKATFYDFTFVAITYLLEGILRVICTILLYIFLQSLGNENEPIQNCLIIALLLSVCNLFQSFLHHVSFFFSMKMGNNMKIGSISFIFDRLFEIKGNILQSSGITSGRLVNLISNDVQRFEECTVVSRNFLYFYFYIFIFLLILLLLLLFLLLLSVIGLLLIGLFTCFIST